VNKLNLIFFGSPYYSIPILEKLISLGHNVSLVISQGSKKLKRGKIIQTAVTEFCKIQNIRCITPECFDKNSIEEIRSCNADMGIIYAYGKIVPIDVIKLIKLGIMNLHCSLLPLYRGAAPIQHALINDDSKTGITFFQINEKLDDGKIILTESYKIKESDNCMRIQDSLTKLAVDKCELAISNMTNKVFSNRLSNKKISYAAKIKKEDSKVTWDMDVRRIFNTIRALHLWPIASLFLCGEYIKVLDASCEKTNHSYHPGRVVRFNKKELTISAKGGLLSILKLQLEGKKPISNRDLFNSHHPFKDKLSNSCINI
tara:strand:- start:8481 stop:9425 length:945 start_codon:yes stop_codon:yes gene_type:complete